MSIAVDDEHAFVSARSAGLLLASFLGYVLSTQCSIVLFAAIQARVGEGSG